AVVHQVDAGPAAELALAFLRAGVWRVGGKAAVDGQSDVGLHRVSRRGYAPDADLLLYGAHGVDVDRWRVDAPEGLDQGEDADAVVEVAAHHHVVVQDVE